MNKLFVLIGYPAVGKTTLAEKFIDKYPQFMLHDVYEYIQPYLNDEGALIDEDLAIEAYQKMYKALEVINQDCILELGTNYPEFNIKQIKSLSDKYHIKVFLCLLSKEEALNRASSRDKVIDEKSLIKRYNRIFPDEHKKYLDSLGLNYVELDMNIEPEILLKNLKIL